MAENNADSEQSTRMNMKDYRRYYAEKHKKFHSKLTKADWQNMRIMDAIVRPQSIDMETISGTEKYIARRIESFYTSDGRYVFRSLILLLHC